MNIMIDKSNIHNFSLNLKFFIDKYIEAFSSIDDKKLLNSFVKDSDKILIAMNSIYHPDVRKIKEESNSLYKAYLNLLDVDSESAKNIYLKYLEKKKEVVVLEKNKLSNP